MAFLSGETIRERLDEFILNENGESVGDPRRIDCNAYTLKIGPEVFVTNSREDDEDSMLKGLNDNDSFVIPSGQFSLILTEEFVSVPKDLMGFISIKAKIKFNGLVNISGFHVDPGWRGRLIFAVYNAGPAKLTFKRGEDAFLLWFSKLDRDTKLLKNGDHGDLQNYNISSSFISSLSGQVYSPYSINNRLNKIETKTTDKLNQFEKSLSFRWAGLFLSFFVGIIIGIFVGVANDWTTDYLSYHKGYKEELIKSIVDEQFRRSNSKKEQLSE